MANQHTKFEISSLSHSGDILDRQTTITNTALAQRGAVKICQ